MFVLVFQSNNLQEKDEQNEVMLRKVHYLHPSSSVQKYRQDTADRITLHKKDYKIQYLLDIRCDAVGINYVECIKVRNTANASETERSLDRFQQYNNIIFNSTVN